VNNPKLQEAACGELLEAIRRTSAILIPTLWINTTHAPKIKRSCGKGGRTTAQSEIAEMFWAWLFPEFMLELMQWYRGFQHIEKQTEN